MGNRCDPSTEGNVLPIFESERKRYGNRDIERQKEQLCVREMVVGIEAGGLIIGCRICEKLRGKSIRRQQYADP